jgi:hypothetical protein
LESLVELIGIEPTVDRALMEKLRETDVVAALALGDFEAAATHAAPTGDAAHHVEARRCGSGAMAARTWRRSE